MSRRRTGGLLVSGALAGLLWSPAGVAATYLNGVRADGLSNLELKDVDVRVDKDGNIWIDAPQYKVEVEAGSGSRRADPPVAAGRYWIVSEDVGSSGQAIEVLINGGLVRVFRSGEAQLVLDLAPYLKHGLNTVLFVPRADAAGAAGSVFLHVGTGTNQAGTLLLDQALIRFSRRADAPPGSANQSFELQVP